MKIRSIVGQLRLRRLENYLTPTDVSKLCTRLPVLRASLRSIDYLPDEPEPMSVEVFHRNVRLYRSSKASNDKLAICFTDNTNSMFFPVPVFLHYAIAAGFDVLIVHDPNRAFHELGFKISQKPKEMNFLNTIGTIRDITQGMNYGWKAALGCSSGGIAALRTSIALKLDRGISLGMCFGSYHFDIHRLTNAAAAFDPLCNCMLEERDLEIELINIYSPSIYDDRRAAERLSLLASSCHQFGSSGKRHYPFHDIMSVENGMRLMARILHPKTSIATIGDMEVLHREFGGS